MAIKQAGKGLSVAICSRRREVFVACYHTHHGGWTQAIGQSLDTMESYFAVVADATTQDGFEPIFLAALLHACANVFHLFPQMGLVA